MLVPPDLGGDMEKSLKTSVSQGVSDSGLEAVCFCAIGCFSIFCIDL